MAQLEVKRKSRSSLWLWLIIIIIIVAAAAYWFTHYYHGSTSMIINDAGETMKSARAMIPQTILSFTS